MATRVSGAPTLLGTRPMVGSIVGQEVASFSLRADQRRRRYRSARTVVDVLLS